MKSFMSAALQDSQPTTSIKPAAGTECSGCNEKAVTSTGQESAEAKPVEKQPVPDTQPKENAVVVMQGPLGTAITEALNKSLAKKSLAAPIQVPNVGTESLTTEYVQANGQINNPSQLFSRISKAVGLVPCVDEKPTAINTMLDAASKVDDIEFLMVEKVESDPSASQVPQKSHMHIVGIDGKPALEEIAIESVQMVVTYRKVNKG
jgi:Ni,Fe-hydrogenase I small subunit